MHRQEPCLFVRLSSLSSSLLRPPLSGQVDWPLTVMDSQYNVPPHWLDGLEKAKERGGRSPDPGVPLLEIVGTGFLEPECGDGWCNLPPRPTKRRDLDAGYGDYQDSQEGGRGEGDGATPRPTVDPQQAAQQEADGAGSAVTHRVPHGDMWKRQHEHGHDFKHTNPKLKSLRGRRH